MTSTFARTEAKRRCWLGLAVAALALASSGCEMPAHATVLKCSATNTSYFDKRQDCTITIEKFDRPTSAGIKIKTRRRLAFVKARFTVQQGSAKITLKGSAGSKAEILVSPGNPGSMEGTVALNRNDNGFNLHFHPVDGVEVVGLAGQLSYEDR